MAGQLINRGENTWVIRIYLGEENGKRVYHNETCHGTRAECDKRRRRLLALADEGLLVRGAGAVDTLDGYSRVWLDTLKRRGLRERTILTYRGQLTRRILPVLGEVKIRELDADAIIDWVNAMQDQGLAARTVRLAFEVLRNLLESAVEQGMLYHNPARAKKITRVLPRDEKKERVTIPMEKVADFLSAAEGDRLAALYHILLMGGLRPSEALALRWQDVRLPVVRVTRVLVDKSEQWPSYAPPKSDRGARSVELPLRSVRIMERHREMQDRERHEAGAAWQDDEGLVFTSPLGEPIKQHTLHRPFRRMLADAGLPHMRLYDLRHSCATLLLEAGEDLELVKQRLGHSTIMLTSDTYGHVRHGLQSRAASTLGGIIDRGTPAED